MSATSIIQRVVRDEIRALEAYHVPDPQEWVKLDAMENPYAWPTELEAPLAAALATAAVNRYPDAAARALTVAIRRAFHVPTHLDILLGNGSDELIQIIAMSAAKPGAVLLSVEPAFVMFRMIASFAGLQYVGVPLKADTFALDEAAMLQAIAVHQPAVIFLAFPNNPTGNLFDVGAVERIIRAAPGVVVIDEAYFAFSSVSLLARMGEFPNAVLMRTVSKLGLAGLRLGMLIGAPEWIAEWNKLRLPYNINSLTQAAATLALDHLPLFYAQTARIVAQRTRVAATLSALLADIPGAQVWPSEANFILVRLPLAEQVFAQLKSHHILVKHTGPAHALLRDTLRITIGTEAENSQLLTALTAILTNVPVSQHD
jgi:histidinol-phosphate aminotransferase